MARDLEGYLDQKKRPWVHLVSFNFIEVSFESVRDDAERHFLNNIGTNFDLNDEQVDHLISAAGQVLRESQEFKEFLERNNGSGDKKEETLGARIPSSGF